MNFKPVDEMSLRHLFSTTYADELLRLSYIGPVLNSAGQIESSPDCIILDKRRRPFRPLRCEFKYMPAGKEDFSGNGKFDIAVIWSIGSLPKGQSRQRFLEALSEQNACGEIIVLEDMKAFRDLPTYTNDTLSRMGSNDVIRKLALNSRFPSVFALCIAAQLYPEKFEMGRMVDFLCSRFPDLKKIPPRGRASVVVAFIKTKPPLLTLMHRDYYRWTSEMDSKSASAELTELIRVNFGGDPPTKEDLERVRGVVQGR